jgi:DNA-binding winged helix-turn-helix (wHTH) protein
MAADDNLDEKKTTSLQGRPVARLMLLSGEGTKSIPLLKEEIIIGRDENCDVVVSHCLVSRRHSRIRWDGVRFILEDLQSTNGTFVNNTRLAKAYYLKNKDELRIGANHYEFADPAATVLETPLPNMIIDDKAGIVYIERHPVELSAKEYALLQFLYRHAGFICSKDEIGKAVWPEYEDAVYDYQIDSLIKRLRQKLFQHGEGFQVIQTIRGRGYRMDLEGGAETHESSGIED